MSKAQILKEIACVRKMVTDMCKERKEARAELDAIQIDA
jgi:hypothetical protein